MQEHLPQVRTHRKSWALLAFIVLLAFFFIWSLGNYGTPAKSNVAPQAPAATNPNGVAPQSSGS